MASKEQLPSGRFRGIYYDSAGQKQRVKGTFATEKEALSNAQEAEIKAQRRASIKRGTQSARMKWRDWWDLVVEDRESSLESDTVKNDRKIAEAYLLPRWGDTSVNQMPTDEIQEWIDEVSRGLHPPPTRKKGAPRRKLKPSYVRRILSVLSMSMGLLVPKVLEVNPCLGVKVARPPKRAKPYSTPGRLDTIREHLRGDYQDAAEFQLETGLRPGEVCGLHAERVDEEGGRLVVAEVRVLHRKMIRAHPKDEDVRVVPLTDKAIEIIRRRLAGRDLTKGCGLPHADGHECTSPLVFRTERGLPMSQEAYAAALRRAAEKAKVDVPSLTPYANRRGFATRAAEGGLNAFDLAILLGHADLRQTQEYVQQTSAARGRLKAALGERVDLILVEGAAWDGRGTGPDSQPLPAAPTEQDQSGAEPASEVREHSNPLPPAPIRSQTSRNRKTAGH